MFTFTRNFQYYNALSVNIYFLYESSFIITKE